MLNHGLHPDRHNTSDSEQNWQAAGFIIERLRGDECGTPEDIGWIGGISSADPIAELGDNSDR